MTDALITPPAGAPPWVADVWAVRDARLVLRMAAATPEAPIMEHALDAMLRAALAAGFGRTTACAVAIAAIEEGLPRLRSPKKAEARRERWTARVADVHAALAGDDGTF